MVKSVYVPEAGGIIDFPDEATPKDIVAYVDRVYGGVGAVPTEQPTDPDESTLLGRAAYGFATGFTDIPSGIAALAMPAEQVAKTTAGRFSEDARKYLQETFGIDPTKDPTAAQQAAEALGSVGSFLVPATGAAKIAALAGRGAKIAGAAGAAADALAAQRAARLAGSVTAAGQGVALGAAQRTQTIQQQLASGMEISPEDQLAAQRLDALIGIAEAAPLERFFGPLTQILSKVPASKAPLVEKIVKSRLSKVTRAGVAEGAQEAASGIANDLVEYGVYNPEVEIGQDLLSNAGTGAFAGSFVEGVIQLAAGRKLRGARQLQQDIAAEKQQNAIAARQGLVSDAAEKLRQYNIDGPVEVVEDEIENVPIFSLRTPAGNVIGEFADRDSLNEAVGIYNAKTGAKVEIREPAKIPDIFPVKIGKKKFDSLDAVRTERDNLISRIQAAKVLATDPIRIKEGASKIGVSEPFYQKKAQDNLDRLVREVEPLEKFVFDAEPPQTPRPITGEYGRRQTEAGIGPQIAPSALSPEDVVDESKRIKESTGAGVALQYPSYKAFLDTVRQAGLPDEEVASVTGIRNEEDFLRVREDEISQYVEEPAKNALRRVYERGGSPYSSNAFGPGLKGVLYEDKDGTKKFEPISPEDYGESSTGPAEAVSAVEPSQPIGATETAPAPSGEGIAAIPEPPSISEEITATGPTPVDTTEQNLSAGLLPEVAAPRKPVRQIEAETIEPRDYTPEQKALDQKVYSELRTRLSSIVPAEVSLKVRDVIDTQPGYLVRGFVRSDGTANDMKVVVEIAQGIINPSLPIEDNIKDLMETLNHEIIHVVRRMGLIRPAEWNILSRAARSAKVPGKKYTYLDKAEAVYAPNGEPITPEYADPEALLEEAVAEMYKDWVINRTAPKNTAGLFNRITEFFRRIFRTLKSNAQEGVFKRIESGEVGQREAAPPQETAVAPDNVESIRFSAAPLPSILEQKNKALFAPAPKKSFKDMIFDFFLGEAPTETLLTTEYGQTKISALTRAALIGRTAAVDRNAMIEFLEKQENLLKTGDMSRLTADYSPLVALLNKDRASHLFAAAMLRGNIAVNKLKTGDILSATLKVEDSPDSLMKVFELMLQPGPPDPATNEPRDKREIFRLYATAKRAIGLKADGKRVPKEMDDNFIKTTISFTEQNYPEIVEAYKMYQRFNRSLLKAAVDAELITPESFANLTKNMDYYGYYYEVFEEVYAPGMPKKVAGRFNLRPYKGTELGGLANDPMQVMLQNSMFWTEAIAKNLAARKSFELAKRMGVARLLNTGEDPDRGRGEEDQVMFFRDKGVDKRFAVSDPLLVSALGSDERIDVGKFWEMIGLPTQVLRETITRDPGFMVANLMRDTLSAWITSGADIMPFIGTVKGFANAYKNGASFQALQGRGVVGSYDLAMLGPAELAKRIRSSTKPKGVTNITSPDALIGVVGSLWNRLGAVSEMSDAATRIAVYDSAIRQGFSEAEAAFRALEIMNFSRRGASQTLSILTKLVPFLNARIQGLDVLYQAGKGAVNLVTGRQQGQRDADLGKKFLIRGGMLAAISVALEMLNDDDEDYQQLDDYIKNSNVLIPLADFGLKGQFIAVPKPFEAGLLFSTFPQQFYKSMTGQASTRENAALFFSSFASTFGVNPIPQFMLPPLEVIVNHDFYTGLPLISEGKARLAPELQYNSGTSSLAMMIGKVPISYNFTTGKFEGVSPIVIDNLISGYTGPFGTYIVQAASLAMEGVDSGPERLPRSVSQLPVVRRFFIDSEYKNPKVVSQAYELFRVVDEANRSYSRLRQIGDAEAVKDYLDENRDILSYKKYVFKLVDGLNKLSAQERRIESDQTMTREEKFEAMAKLRETRMKLAAKVTEINAALGR